MQVASNSKAEADNVEKAACRGLEAGESLG